MSKAARAGQVDAFNVLLDAGASLDIQDVDGRFAGDCFKSKAREVRPVIERRYSVRSSFLTPHVTVLQYEHCVKM